jgi:ribosomal protein S18 acetylase RimI-like enzyme
MAAGPTDDFVNIIWRCMDGSQRHLTSGTARARRYLKGFSPIVAFADPDRPAFDDLADVCEPGERFYCSEWAGAVPAGWTLERDARMLVMVWQGATPEPDPTLAAVPLGAEHVARMCALAELTRPGPFDTRTIEFGDYFGILDGERLAAMAGERMHAGHLREVSGICTHPDYQGRGYARRLTALVVRRELARGQTPFLHVVATNVTAIALYERMGFVTARNVPVRIVSRATAG